MPEDRPPSQAEPPQSPQSHRDASPASAAWIGMTGLGFEFLAAILLPGALGWWIDRMLGWRPWLMIVGGAIGFFAGLRLLMLAARKSFGSRR